MSRIRTIKPEFFTSDDITSLSPLSRLFYVSLWCESDREGRLNWNIKTLKQRYFPADQCDISAMAKELCDAKLIVIYESDGRSYAEIPSFKNHQVVNNREAESILPPRVKVACTRVSVEGKEGREGKGIGEQIDASANNKKTTASATRLPADWVPNNEDIDFITSERPELNLEFTASRFKDYWAAQPGVKGRKADWSATWRNWVRNENKPKNGIGGSASGKIWEQ